MVSLHYPKPYLPSLGLFMERKVFFMKNKTEVFKPCFSIFYNYCYGFNVYIRNNLIDSIRHGTRTFTPFVQVHIKN